MPLAAQVRTVTVDVHGLQEEREQAVVPSLIYRPQLTYDEDISDGVETKRLGFRNYEVWEKKTEPSPWIRRWGHFTTWAPRFRRVITLGNPLNDNPKYRPRAAKGPRCYVVGDKVGDKDNRALLTVAPNRWAAEPPTGSRPFTARAALDTWAIERGEVPGYTGGLAGFVTIGKEGTGEEARPILEPRYYETAPDDRPRPRLGGYASPRWDDIDNIAGWAHAHYKEYADRQKWKTQGIPALRGLPPRKKLLRPAAPVTVRYTSREQARAAFRAMLCDLVRAHLLRGGVITACEPAFVCRAGVIEPNVRRRPGRPTSGEQAMTDSERQKRKYWRDKENDGELQNPVGQRRKPEEGATYSARHKIFGKTEKGQRNARPPNTINPASRSRDGDGRADQDRKE